MLSRTVARWWMPAIAVAAGLPLFPAAAQTAASAAATATQPSTALAFRPPLDKPLRYRVVQSRTRSNQPSGATDWIEILRFAKTDTGFRLEWHIDAASVASLLRNPGLAPLLAPFTGEPIAFDLDPTGEVLTVRDWDQVRPRLLASIDALTNQGLDRTALTAVRSLFERITAEQAPALLLKSVQPVFSWSGVALQPGAPRSTIETVTIPVFNIPLDRTTTVTLEPITNPAERRFHLFTRVEDAAFKRMMAQIAAQMGIAPDSPKGKAMQANLAQTTTSIRDESVAVVDAATALPRFFRNERSAAAEGQQIRQTLELTLLD